MAFILQKEAVEKGIILFDFDGTLVKSDTVILFLLFILKSRKYMPLIFLPLLVLGLLFLTSNRSTNWGFSLILWVLTLGLNPDKFAFLCTKFCNYYSEMYLPKDVNQKVLLELQNYASKGYQIIVISGSANLWLDVIVSKLETRNIYTIGSKYVRFLGGYIASPRCFRAQKTLLLQNAIQPFIKPKFIAGFCDTYHDRFIMDYCEKKYLVHSIFSSNKKIKILLQDGYVEFN